MSDSRKDSMVVEAGNEVVRQAEMLGFESSVEFEDNGQFVAKVTVDRSFFLMAFGVKTDGVVEKVRQMAVKRQAERQKWSA